MSVGGRQSFYRYMSWREVEAIRQTGLLRGGRSGRCYWTDQRYEEANKAGRVLALEYRPQARMEFRITNDPNLAIDGERVNPAFGEPGGGRQWMSLDRVEVEVIAVDGVE